MALDRRSRVFPKAQPLRGAEQDIPYFLVSDEAFGMRENLLKPFSHRDLNREHRIFNYRLSRARRVVENAFGILANRFRVLHTKIALQPPTVEKVVQAICVLHNILCEEGGSIRPDAEDAHTHVVQPGPWRADPQLMQAPLGRGTNVTIRAKAVRDYMVQYLNSDVGAVTWQDAML